MYVATYDQTITLYALLILLKFLKPIALFFLNNFRISKKFKIRNYLSNIMIFGVAIELFFVKPPSHSYYHTHQPSLDADAVGGCARRMCKISPDKRRI